VKRHQELLTAAIERDSDGQRALFEGRLDAARAAFGEASELYRQSWEQAPPGGYGRLVGMLKSAVLAGGGSEAATYAGGELEGRGEDSPTASYARGLAALIAGDGAAAARASERMRGGSEAFDRTADAVAALAAGDPQRYAAALERIVRDFEQRTEHLTGVAIADTALVLQQLAARRGMAVELASPALPNLPLTPAT
jgi:hypothetical protein